MRVERPERLLREVKGARAPNPLLQLQKTVLFCGGDSDRLFSERGSANFSICSADY